MAAQDFVEVAHTDALVAASVCVEGGLDVLPFDESGSSRCGEVIRLTHQVVEGLGVGCEALGVAGEARRVFNHARYGHCR
jgi:hypothetical protein